MPGVPITLPLRRSAFGTPVVTVLVNGRPHEFWLDTGASMTLLSAEVAIESGIRLAAPDTLALGVVSGHIDARAIYVDSLAIGGFVAHGLTAAVVNRNVLRLDHSVVNGVTRAVPIDGVIGADLIRHMDLVIDAHAGTLTIREPRKSARVTRNLFWVGYPVVRLVSRDGQPLIFGLDTGAEGSYVTSTLLRKLPRTPIAARRGAITGLGTETTLTEWVARDIRLSDGDYAVSLRNTPVAPARRWTFVDFDGIIGSDVALGTRLHLDFTNGVFDVRPTEAIQKGVTVTVSP
jgi:clan AA aspartic protease (TIGR02281 family)